MEWLDTNKKKPQCNMRDGSIGVEVFVKPFKDETAFYGRRLGGKPCFYKYGEVITGVTKWAPLNSID
jgi:hypothetical protein